MDETRSADRLPTAAAPDRLRFQIETEAVARLQHSNIVPLHEVGEVRGQPFFSLEFCDGGTLTEHLKKQRPSPRESAELIETLARAMHYAHLRGVVHRDLKPGNVRLTAEGTPKITDFGLAKRIDNERNRLLSRSASVFVRTRRGRSRARTASRPTSATRCPP